MEVRAHRPPRERRCLQRGGDTAVEPHGSRPVRQQPRAHAQQRRLADAVGAEHDDDLVAMQLEIHRSKQHALAAGAVEPAAERVAPASGERRDERQP
jgi:hypothetical protein